MRLLIAYFLLFTIPAYGGVTDGQPVNAATTNAAFLSKNVNDTTIYVLGVLNGAVASGPSITNIQREFNAQASFLGMSVNQVYNILPTWPTSNRGSGTDTVFARAKALDTAFDGTTGHSHNGTAGNGPKIAPGALSQGGANPGDEIVWNGASWAATADNAITALTTDVVATGPGNVAATIQSNVVTNSKLAQMPTHTIKGNNTGGTANALDLTRTQLTAELNAFTSVLQGAVPASGGGTANFLRADGVFAPPSPSPGTVTSVDVAVPAAYSSTGGPITSSGTITLTAPSRSYELGNIGISATVSANTLIVALKQADGSTNCGSGSAACIAGFRNPTSATGGQSQASFTAANSITLGTTDSIGTVGTVAGYLYVYLIQDTTSEICLSRNLYDEGSVQNASALTGGADTGAVLWCTSAHTTRPYRMIGRIFTVWNNPNWGFVTEASVVPFTRGYVTSDSAGGQSIESIHRATISSGGACAAGNCTINSQDGSWITTFAFSATGIYIMTIAANVFSGPPTCEITASDDAAIGGVATATSVTFNTFNVVTGGAQNASNFNVICMGPRNGT